MKKVYNLIASLFAMVATLEVGTASFILLHQPELPKK